MDYPEELQPILDRFRPPSVFTIDCDKGWWHILIALDKELASVDPDYVLYQAKEKLGGLRYYISNSSPHFSADCQEVINKFEKVASMTCEVTGKHGDLMSDGFRLRTLNEDFLDQGWKLFHPKKTDLSE